MKSAAAINFLSLLISRWRSLPPFLSPRISLFFFIAPLRRLVVVSRAQHIYRIRPFALRKSERERKNRWEKRSGGKARDAGCITQEGGEGAARGYEMRVGEAEEGHDGRMGLANANIKSNISGAVHGARASPFLLSLSLSPSGLYLFFNIN